MAANDVCYQRIYGGYYSECKVLGMVASNPETDAVYGQYMFRIYRVSEEGSGYGFLLIYMEGSRVVGTK